MRHAFKCIEGHTAGNPVRLVIEGAPALEGATMRARRHDFIKRYDWIRLGLMFEPRGHDMMSGGFLCPPTEPESDAAILFMETSGCLPMCGHGAIGILTFALEHGLITPKTPGRVIAEVPAGRIEATYTEDRGRVTAVRLRNVASFVAKTGIEVESADLGPLHVDVAYGGNFYAIIEPQGAFSGLDDLGAPRLIANARALRENLRGSYTPSHPEDETISGVTHVLWADKPKSPGAHGRNAVFYGERAIDRSPCGTGTSARLAHLHAQGRLKTGEAFVHESYIGSRFIGRVEAETRVGGEPAIIPSIEGAAFQTGVSAIWIDDAEPFPHGFTVL